MTSGSPPSPEEDQAHSSSSSSSSSIPIPARSPGGADANNHNQPDINDSSCSTPRDESSLKLRRTSSFAKGRLQVPVSRSYYSTRSDDSGSHLLDETQLARSAAQVRQQTLSWTYRELQLATTPAQANASTSLQQTGSSRARGPRVGAASPLREVQMSDDGDVNTSVTTSSKVPGPLFDPAWKEKRDNFERRRQISQLSALRQLALSIEQEAESDDLEIGDQNEHEHDLPITEKTPLLAHGSNGPDVSDVANGFDSAQQVEEGSYKPPFIGEIFRQPSSQASIPSEYRYAPPIENPSRKGGGRSFSDFVSSVKSFKPQDILNYIGFVIATIPAVILALILNLLDAMSYGIIIFPTAESYIPDTAIQSGISMFLASTVISQLIYTLGGSAFTGAVGSMMIEVMPFLHIICRTISNEMQGASHHSILATVMVAYAMSTLLTGFVFLMLGIFKLGNLVQFFPRHILVGCIGGIGLFLILTGVEVTTGITTAYTWEYLRAIFEPSELKLWGSSFGLAVFLKMMQRRIHHPLFVPLFYVCVPILFYIIVFAGRFALEDVRKAGWLISLPEGPPAAFYEFWTYYDFSAVNWKAVPATIPTQLALAFFGILHVPINVPALAVSTHQDVDLNRELIGHGISNLVSGCFGATQNYLVYSNSLLYIRSGGNSVTGGLMLALGTAVVWIAGGKVIGFVPTIVVGSLIFHLGIDLLKESVWDTWNTGIHMLEYMTIISIVTIMGVVGFTEGILTGVVLACVFFVVMYARRSVVRATYTGSQLRSTVHRLYRQQYFLDQVGEQIHVIKLQGFMFFGTINQLDIHIANALKTDSRIRYIVVDFSLIYGIDYSALESFHRIKRMLRERRTHLVFAGLTTVGKTLAQSGILDEEESDASDETLVHAFEDINEALEWCENQLLVTYYHKMVARDDAANKKTDTRSIPTRHDVSSRVQDADHGSGVFGLTPRQKDVHQAASLVLTAAPVQPPVSTETFLPVASLLQAFSEPGDYDPELLHFCEGKFERVEIKKGTILWVPGEDPKELYVVHEGELLLMIKDNEARAPEGAMKIVETLLPGTMVGELELFSNRPRTCRLVANSDAVIWRLSKESCDELAEADPKLMLKFVTKIALGFDAVRFYNTVYHWAQLK